MTSQDLSKKLKRAKQKYKIKVWCEFQEESQKKSYDSTLHQHVYEEVPRRYQEINSETAGLQKGFGLTFASFADYIR